MTRPRHRLPKRTESSAEPTVEAEATETAAEESTTSDEPRQLVAESAESNTNETGTDATDTDETAPEESVSVETVPDESVTDETATDEPAEADAEADVTESSEPDAAKRRRINWPRALAFGVLPAVVLVLALAAGYLKWQDISIRNSEIASTESVQAAKDSTVALLSYQPATVEQQLTAARDLLTGGFRDSYAELTNDVVIPGAKQQQVTAVAQVPAASSVSASPERAVALVFVNQIVTVGTGSPTNTASSVKVTLEKVDGRWLISEFEPI